MKCALPTLCLLAALAPALVSAQQPVFHSAAEYDAWKAHFATSGETYHSTAQGEVPDASRGGGAATCDCWITPDASYHTIDNNTEWSASGFSSGDDGSYGPINLPFSFYLYGQYWNTAYININGNVSFGTYFSTFSSTGFPVSDYTMVAPFWADVDVRGAGAGDNIVQYKVTPTALYVNWTRVGYYSMMTDKVNTFQLVITDGVDPVIQNGANVSFCYKDMQWTTGSASSGVGGFGGTPASVGANQGNGTDYLQFGRFDHAGVDYSGPFYGSSGPWDGVSWLDDKYFTFATSVTTGNVPPVVTGQSVCDSLTVCADQLTQLSVDFLSPEQDQITTATSEALTMSNYSIISNTSGLTANIVSEFTPTAADVGYHDVFFYGTDNGVPSLTSTLKIVIHVLPSPDLQSTTTPLCDTGSPVDMVTLLGGTPVAGGSWTDAEGQPVSGTFTPGTTADGAYQYIVDFGAGCSDTAVATVNTVTHVNAGYDASLAYCSWDFADDMFLHLTGGAESGGAWLDPNGTAFTQPLDPATAPVGVYEYILTATTPCPNDTAFVTVAIPHAVDAGHDTSIVFCRDAAPFSMRSQLAGTPQATGTWTNILGATVPDLFDPATGTIGIYTYTVPATLPCPDQSAALTINIDALPQAGLDSALVICANGGNTPLFPLLGNGADDGGQWTDPLDSIHSGVLDPSLEISGTYTYVVNGPGTCVHLTDTARVNVHIDPLAVITFTADPDSGCHPLNVLFTNTTDPIYVGNSCVWDPGDGTGTVQECGSFQHIYELPGWYHVKLTVTTPQGCTNQLIAPGAVLVDPAPLATFTWTPNPGTEANSNLVFTATDPHAVDFLWTFPGQTYQTGQQVPFNFPHVLGDDYSVCLSVKDRYGCADTLCDTISIIVPNFFVPLGFTPDGNGINDVFRPVATDFAPEDYKLQIFDRWGQLQFESQSADLGWDGKGKNGSILPEGAYVWRMSLRPLTSSDLEDRYGVVTLSK